MKIIVSLVLFLASFQVHAVTRSTFPYGGQQAIVMVAAKSMDGTTDNDGYRFFQLMNVPIQNSMMGPGKVIYSNDRDINITCAQRQGVGTECSWVVSHSPRVKIDFLQKTIEVRISGEDAASLASLFFTDLKGDLDYRTSDDKLHFAVHSGEILIRFAENP